jgi:hypothetical protein
MTSARRSHPIWKDGRPESACRRLFLRSRAPFDGLGSHSDICQIVHRAIDRSGIELKVTGAHQLRHALAVDMLRQGLSLTEIGQVLRHRSAEAARRYAKVDLESLRAVALPWCDTIRRLLGSHCQTEGGSKYRTEGLIHAVTVWKTSSRGSATFAVGYLRSSGGWSSLRPSMQA